MVRRQPSAVLRGEARGDARQYEGGNGGDCEQQQEGLRGVGCV